MIADDRLCNAEELGEVFLDPPAGEFFTFIDRIGFGKEKG